jgi:hypothetical protein
VFLCFVAQEGRLDVLVVLKLCWAAQRERDTASELRQSLSRQVTDLTQHLTILEEENTLLRNLGLLAPLHTDAGGNVLVDALDDKDARAEGRQSGRNAQAFHGERAGKNDCGGLGDG